MNVRMGKFAIVALGGLLLAGCGAASKDSSSDKPAAQASPEVAPADQILDSIPGKDAGPYHFAFKGAEGSGTGVVDAVDKSAQAAFEVNEKAGNTPIKVSIGLLVLDQKSWTKIKVTPAEFGKLPSTKWQKLDLAKVKDAEANGYVFGDAVMDPATVTQIVQASSDAKKTGDNAFAGTFDLAQAVKNGASNVASDDTVKALGAKASAVPFTVTLDGQNHLSKLVAHIPAAGKAKAYDYTVTYDQYGSAAKPVAPAANQQQNAVPLVYEILNG